MWWQQHDYERETVAGEKLDTQPVCYCAELPKLSQENVKTITGPTVEEVHAVQGAQYQRKANSTVECKLCGKTHEKK